MQNQEANSHPFNLGTAAVDNSPRRFPASLVPSVISGKLSCSVIKLCVLVVTDKPELIDAIAKAVMICPDMQRYGHYQGDAHIYRGAIRYRESGSNPCLVVLASSQSDSAFSSLKFAVGGEPMQVIAMHDGPLAKGSAFETLASYLSAEPMQLEGGL